VRGAATLKRMHESVAHRDPYPAGEPPSPFRHAFGRARVEALAAGGLALEDEREATTNESESAAHPRFEYRLERRQNKRSADEADWNALGRQGWELVGVTGKHAAFKRAL
jgi:hypothetical protein